MKPEIANLVKGMLNKNPLKRLNIHQILLHEGCQT